MDKLVYVVVAGDYSDFHICGVFSTRENAEALMEHENSADYSDEARIQEWTLDERVSLFAQGYECWRVHFDDIHKADASAHRVTALGDDTERAWKGKEWATMVYDVDVWAKSQADALKVANEKRFQYAAKLESTGE